MEAEMGRRIKGARERVGLTQEDLAERLSVSRQAVSKWEADLSRPSTDNLLRLAEVLETDLHALTGKPGEPADPPRPIDPPAVRRAKLLFPWLIVPGVVFVFFLIGFLILLTSGRGSAGETPIASPPAEFPDSIPLTASDCRDFEGNQNYGDAVDPLTVEDGYLFQYRFPNTNAVLTFYRAESGVQDLYRRPLYHLWAAYGPGDGTYTAVARIAEDRTDAGAPRLAAYEALGRRGCKVETLEGAGRFTYYFALSGDVPELLFLIDGRTQEGDVDADGENEIVALETAGDRWLFDRGVDDYTAYGFADPLPAGTALTYDGTDFYLTDGGGESRAYHHLWNGVLSQEEVRGTDFSNYAQAAPDVGGTVLTFVGDQFSDGVDPDVFYGRDEDGDPLPTHRQLAYMGLQTLYGLTGIRLERCYVLATEFGVYYAMDRNFDRRSFYSFDRGADWGGGELAIAGCMLSWRGGGTEWSPLEMTEAVRPESADTVERALWAYAHAPLLQRGEIERTGWGPGEEVRLFLKDERFFEISTDPAFGALMRMQGPYPAGFEH